MGTGAVTRVRTAAVVLLFLLIQQVVLPDLRIGSLRGDAFVALAVGGGLVGGPERGAVVGFMGGLVADLFLQTPFGLSALVLSLVGFSVGMLQTLIIRSAWWIPAAIAFLVGGAAAALWGLAGAVVGHPELVTPRLIPVTFVVAAYAALLCPLAMRTLRWAWGPMERAL